MAHRAALAWLALLVSVQLASATGNSSNSLTDLKSQIDKTIQPLVDSKKNVGVVVGIIQRDKKDVFGYGEVVLGSRRRPDGNTVFEIGSMTKVFTALLLADMARDGLVGLDDPVRKLLPEPVKVPVYQHKDITLLHLATHTSALPRMPDNFITLKGVVSGNVKTNPYVDYTPTRLYAFLSNHRLEYEPGTRHQYSNLGMGLLGHALSLAAKTGYEQLVCSRICKPLQMDSTAITLTPELRSRLAQGHTCQEIPLLHLRIRNPAQNWDIPTLAGAGALRSTANDLLRFLAANLGMTITPLKVTIESTHVSQYKTSDTGIMAMGWIVDTGMGEPEFWHNGGTGGYASFMGFCKQSQAAVVVLSNTSSSVDLEALAILSLLSRQ